MSSSHYLVLGAGPVGQAVAAEFTRREPGSKVTIASRSGRPGPAGTQQLQLDVTSASDLQTAAKRMDGIVNCLNPPHYHRWPQEWPPLMTAILETAATSGAPLATVGNLYPYGAAPEPITAETPEHPRGKKGRVRSQMWRQVLAAHQQGRVSAVEIRAADYLTWSGFGIFTPALKAAAQGKPALVLGKADLPHSIAHIPDVARTAVAALLAPQTHGRLWIVPSPPPLTQRETLSRVAEAAGWPQLRLVQTPAWFLALGGLFAPMLREQLELHSERTQPFTVDASETSQILGVTASSWEHIVDEVITQSQTKS